MAIMNSISINREHSFTFLEIAVMRMGNIQLFCDILLRVSKSGTNSPYAVAAINLIEIHKNYPR